ncbi:MAG: T9SS type A sorting domain-containing protein [Bacteroidetes bacterium]|jgi:thiol-disulfide isomerase/thioredoxin|nr:T9SS type A sorting domain-containing protein [Bacteroidota bacterium]MBT7144272.1 T9SS type A sorting domain-containing protein [Bacteroidota bacterium]MBT7492938.1 T9SS type A sorting domain-containing protein [Bacteroidota bacterium]
MVRYILFLVVIFGIEKVSFAQLVVGDTVTDFTIVDVHNNEHNLFNYLENGKYVCVDFFGVNCQQCLTLVPTFNEVYSNYGCNKGDLVFLAINYLNYNDEILDFEDKYGGLYPAISGMSGGYTVYEDWQIQFWPQLWLICPNKIFVSNIYPIYQENIDSVFASFGITKDSCPTNNILYEIVSDASINIFPDPATTHISIEYFNQSTYNHNYNIYNMLGEILMEGKVENNATIDISMLKRGIYIFVTKSQLSLFSKKTFIKL